MTCERCGRDTLGPFRRKGPCQLCEAGVHVNLPIRDTREEAELDATFFGSGVYREPAP